MLHSDIVTEHECDGEFMNVSESRFRHEDLVLQVRNRVLLRAGFDPTALPQHTGVHHMGRSG
jgi:hypothetical protein